VNDQIGMARELRSLYGKYLEGAQPLRHEGLAPERADILGCEGALHREPLVEPVPRYPEAGTLVEVGRELGLRPDFAHFARLGAIAPGRNLYVHQQEALRSVCVRGGRWS
jgi:ATP-dependent helicase YprA (DUF1998 family)